MKKPVIALLTLSFICAVSIADQSSAKDSSAQTGSELPKEKRKKMAEMHEKMALCLKSDKSMDDCRDEMRKQCDGEDGCPMMGKGHRGMMGKGHKKMMNHMKQDSESKE
ncbi:MAG: hypothetical protein AB7H48_12955 [Parachlamydiales bacterium]